MLFPMLLLLFQDIVIDSDLQDNVEDDDYNYGDDMDIDEEQFMIKIQMKIQI